MEKSNQFRSHLAAGSGWTTQLLRFSKIDRSGRLHQAVDLQASRLQLGRSKDNVRTVLSRVESTCTPEAGQKAGPAAHAHVSASAKVVAT